MKPDDRGMLNAGSLFNTSEGLLSASFVGAATTLLTEDVSDNVKMLALGSLAAVVSVYTLSRSIYKHHA